MSKKYSFGGEVLEQDGGTMSLALQKTIEQNTDIRRYINTSRYTNTNTNKQTDCCEVTDLSLNQGSSRAAVTTSLTVTHYTEGEE